MKFYSSGIRHDYKDAWTLRRSRGARRALLFAAGVALPLVVVALFRPDANEPVSEAADRPMLAGPTHEIRLPLPSPERTAVAARKTGVVGGAAEDVAKDAAASPTQLVAFAEQPQASRLSDTAAALLNLVVARGDTLEKLFRRNRLSLSDLAAMVALPEAARELTRIRPGDKLEIAARDGQVLSLKRELDEIRVLSITRHDSGFGAEIIDRPVDVRVVGAHGVIKTALAVDGDKAGLSWQTIAGIYDRFKWDIDFMMDVRQGDRFTVIYEELWRDGVKLRDGEVIAAEFVNQGKVYRAARYRNSAGNVDDYFTPEGRSLRKTFLRAPLNFTRISSAFNPSRRHPVLNTIRAHRGVDYAAPTGTPVEAAGDGRIITRGTKGGYGNTVEIDHGGEVTTLYGHLSGFARGQKVGTRVKQGEVIGYVGQSGLATGPHLHYEYRVQGVHKNPVRVPLPSADPVPTQYLSDFQRVTAPLWRQLDAYAAADTATVVTTAGTD